MEIDKILISNKVFSSEENCKYVIDDKDNCKIRPMSIILQKKRGQARYFDVKLYAYHFDKR